jgi:tRNA (uracil-5-)-methyltransferase
MVPKTAPIKESAENTFIHRVKIVNLPAHEIGSIKKLLQTFDLHRFKKAPKWDYAYMNFEVRISKANYNGTFQIIR